MLPANTFRKMFMYILMDYCEDTCTTQDELYNIVMLEPSLEKLIGIFAEEGFMEWYPKDAFPCANNVEADYDNSYFDPDDIKSLPCYEQYWKSLCNNHEVDFNLFLATL